MILPGGNTKITGVDFDLPEGIDTSEWDAKLPEDLQALVKAEKEQAAKKLSADVEQNEREVKTRSRARIRLAAWHPAPSSAARPGPTTPTPRSRRMERCRRSRRRRPRWRKPVGC